MTEVEIFLRRRDLWEREIRKRERSPSSESCREPDWQHGSCTVGQGGRGQTGDGGGGLTEQLGDDPAGCPVLRGRPHGGGGGCPQGGAEWKDWRCLSGPLSGGGQGGRGGGGRGRGGGCLCLRLSWCDASLGLTLRYWTDKILQVHLWKLIDGYW